MSKAKHHHQVQQELPAIRKDLLSISFYVARTLQKVDGCVSIPTKVVHFLWIQQERSSIFQESEQRLTIL